MTGGPGDALFAVRLTAAAWADVRDDCVRRRPEEACGLLLGRDNGVGRAAAVENVWPDAAERVRRYAIDPLTQMRIESAAAAAGEDVVGFYHSHPAGPAVPSDFDLGRAWPGYVYLIVGFESLIGPTSRAWALDGGGVFREHAVRIL